MLPFLDKLASVIYQLLDGQNMTTNKTKQNLLQLSPGESEQDLKRKYNVMKIRLTMLIVMIGSFTALLLWILNGNKTSLVDGTSIHRNYAGGGTKEVTLSAKGEGGQKANIAFTVKDCSYSNEELIKIYEEFKNVIDGIVLNQNDSWDCISTDLSLVKRVTGYPFDIEWESNDNLYLTDSGQIVDWSEMKDNKPKVKQIELCMKVTYRNFLRKRIYQATVCPKQEEKSFQDIVQSMVEETEKSTSSQMVIKLPQFIDGEKVEWSELSESKSLTIFLLSVVTAVAIWVMKDRQVAKLVQKKRLLLDEEYQAIISKLTLYLGAGMNLNSAWIKVAREGRGNPVYNEMLITCREMEGGIPEKEAYEHFARRVRQQQYVKLITFLVQNLQKGNTEILLLLKQESLLAMENYHALAKRRGEEMGTKLLFPMVLMLGMVMVLVIVPVFLAM
ncbi:MAG TPA: type II secretion system F family protein [Lachnospiraceae bacterium]|nr:type II secretion system F family protein [Lachnospiraceae bacterium]